jgi:hypothetical protein
MDKFMEFIAGREDGGENLVIASGSAVPLAMAESRITT